MGNVDETYFDDKVTDPAPAEDVAEVEGEAEVTEGDEAQPAADEPEANSAE